MCSEFGIFGRIGRCLGLVDGWFRSSVLVDEPRFEFGWFYLSLIRHFSIYVSSILNVVVEAVTSILGEPRNTCCPLTKQFSWLTCMYVVTCVVIYGFGKISWEGSFFNISVLVDLNNFCQMKSVDLELNFSNHNIGVWVISKTYPWFA